MSEEILDGAQVGAAVQKVRRVAVPERVGRRTALDSGSFQPDVEAASNIGCGQPTTIARNEQCTLTCSFAANQVRTAPAEPRRSGNQRRFSDGDRAHLVALTVYTQRLTVEVEVADIERHDLLPTQTASVRELEHRPVAQPRRVGTAGRIQQLGGVSDRQHLRQMCPARRCREACGRTRRDQTVLPEHAVQPAD